MASHTPHDDLALGKPAEYVDTYTPSLLQGIDRAAARAPLGLDGDLPFVGFDVWNAYELSWLNRRGRPEAAWARITVPITTPRMCESKSLKLYLNSFSGTRFASRNEVEQTLEADLKLACRAPVMVYVLPLDQLEKDGVTPLAGTSLDTQDLDIDEYEVSPHLLETRGDVTVREVLFTHLLRSRCPVTGQPDWGSLWIRYAGAPIDHASLLRYVISYRNHQGFHEETVERIWRDIRQICRPDSLTVHAYYLRRGGIDINPYRSDKDPEPPRGRLARQ